MAKRKQNKSFASNRASQANAQRQKDERRQSIISALILGVLTVLVIMGLNWWSNSPTAEPSAPAAPVELSGERPLASIDPTARNGYYSAPPPMTIDTSKEYEAIIRTEKGDMVIQLFAEQAPVTVNNFVFLANQGFYDNTTFHRVIDGFMAQAGDPLGQGFGGAGYDFEDEFTSELRFDRRGLLAMANSGPATNSSQFFITFAATEWLNDAHTIFGEVIEGDDVLSQIRIRDPGEAEPGDLIERIDIIEK